jgi:hypothetical protein
LALKAETLGVQSDGEPICTITDANEDEYPDLVCEFMDDPGTWVSGNGMAGLTGVLQDGMTVIGGVDEICVNAPLVAGDLDGDGDIDGDDYSAFLATFGKCDGADGYNPEADYDGDSCITFIDYQIWYGFYVNQ